MVIDNQWKYPERSYHTGPGWTTSRSQTPLSTRPTRTGHISRWFPSPGTPPPLLVPWGIPPEGSSPIGLSESPQLHSRSTHPTVVRTRTDPSHGALPLTSLSSPSHPSPTTALVSGVASRPVSVRALGPHAKSSGGVRYAYQHPSTPLPRRPYPVLTYAHVTVPVWGSWTHGLLLPPRLCQHHKGLKPETPSGFGTFLDRVGFRYPRHPSPFLSLPPRVPTTRGLGGWFTWDRGTRPRPRLNRDFGGYGVSIPVLPKVDVRLRTCVRTRSLGRVDFRLPLSPEVSKTLTLV